MVTGLEPALAKTALSSVSRVAAPVGGRLRTAWIRRQVKQEFYSGVSAEETNSFVESIEPEAASELVNFASSVELRSLAMSVATDHILGSIGRSGSKIDREVKEQLKLLIRLNTSVEETIVDAATELIFTALSREISAIVSEISDDANRLSPSAKASLLKVRESYIDSAVRNSMLLADIQEVSLIKSFEEQFRLQIRNLYGTMRLPHAGTTKRVPYDRLYVQPRVRPIMEEPSATAVRQIEGIAIEDLSVEAPRVVILGDPGGGKSTLSLKMTFDYASSDYSGNGKPTVPFLVVLREYAAEISKSSLSLLEYIGQQSRMLFSVEEPPGAIEYLLLNGRAIVIFDGLDELLDTALRRRVVDAVTAFATRYPAAPIVVTSRKVGYGDAPLDPDLFTAFTLCEFSEEQVEQYSNNWFELDESIQPGRRQGLSRSFLEDSVFVDDLRVNPLMLSLMCGIYASENYIPRNRPDVYEKCALLLFESWDKQRGIKASLPFDAHVQAAMRSLALWLYPQQASQKGLPRGKLISYMKDYLMKKRFDDEGEAENAATEFIDFCKGRAWVLTDIGSELYGFTHRTFLEYFAASQIVRENADPSRLFDYLLERLQGGGWEVVAQLSLQILNKSVEDGADDFLEVLLVHASSDISSSLRGKLLSFASQALTYIVPRPPVLREMVRQIVRYYRDVGRDEESNSLYLLMGSSPENLRLISKYLYEAVSSALQQDPSDRSALFVALYTDVIAYRGALHGDLQVALRNMEFWKRQVRENSGQFENLAKLQKKSDVSAGLYLLEHGLCSTREFISWHGVGPIFAVPPGSTLARISSLPLAVRILLRFTREPSFRSMAEGTTGMNYGQIEELKNALLDISGIPWFAAGEGSELPDFGGYFLANYRGGLEGPDSLASISAILLLLMATCDLGDQFVTSRVRARERKRSKRRGREGVPVSIFLASQVVGARDSLLRLSKQSGESSTAGEGMLFSDMDEIRESLSSAEVDGKVIGLIERWIEDPKFMLIRGVHSR